MGIDNVFYNGKAQTRASFRPGTAFIDPIEAIKDVFGDAAESLVVSSTKSMHGHMLGAAGAVEAIVCVKALETGAIPPTINLENPSEGCDLDLCANEAKKKGVKVALSNSFGFGGTNTALAMVRFED